MQRDKSIRKSSAKVGAIQGERETDSDNDGTGLLNNGFHETGPIMSLKGGGEEK